jgi:hypothetical protein
LHHLDEKFDIKDPTIILFFKKKFMYDVEFSEAIDLKAKTILGDLYSGFVKTGRTSKEQPVTPEMIEM